MFTATMALLAATLLITPIREVFHFGAVRPAIIGCAIGVGITVMLILDLLKRIGLRPLPACTEASG